MSVPIAPERGDIILISRDPQRGHEQAGRREVALEGSASITGVVLADHVKSLDWKARAASVVDRDD